MKHMVRVVFMDDTSTVFDYFLKPQLDLYTLSFRAV